MLIKFRFKNHKTFRDETVLDLQAASLEESKNQVRNSGSEKILPVVAIYGPNASGKSNVIDAFGYMAQYLRNSIIFDDGSEDLVQERNSVPKLNPFRFGRKEDLENPVSEFEVWFTVPNDDKQRTFNYGFSLTNEGVSEEWMNCKARTGRSWQTVFYRNQTDISFSSKIERSSQKFLIDAVGSRTLLVSLGARLNIHLLKLVFDWFKNSAAVNFGDPIINVIFSRTIESGFIDDEKQRNEYVSFLSSFDDSICGFEIDEVPSQESGNEPAFDIRTVHQTADHQLTSLPLNEESDGTLKMIALYPLIRRALKNGGVLFVDELNARLHPLLVRLLIQTFADPQKNPNNAQLIMTLHDVWQLKDNILRRDEIWFTQKDSSGVSELFSLFDFEDESGKKIRKDEDYLKNYLTGKYGAIPMIKEIEPIDLLNQDQKK